MLTTDTHKLFYTTLFLHQPTNVVCSSVSSLSTTKLISLCVSQRKELVSSICNFLINIPAHTALLTRSILTARLEIMGCMSERKILAVLPEIERTKLAFKNILSQCKRESNITV